MKVKVPLDWSGEMPGELELPLMVTEGSGPVVLDLSGGPGQPSTPWAEFSRIKFGRLAPEHRVAVIDQRGTGETAIDCGALQRLHITDFTVRPRSAVRACGEHLGFRRSLYSTTASVRDLEEARKTIGVKRMAITGTSYGTYVAMRYARAYPNRVSRLILDSVVPQEDVDPFLRATLRRAGMVLRRECGKGRCGFRTDPARDLARLVRKKPRKVRLPGRSVRLRVDGPALVDWATSLFSFKEGGVPDFARAVHRAARGDYRKLARVAAEAWQVAKPSPASEMSWGLHAATVCSDFDFPFSVGSDAPGLREHLARRYSSAIPARAFWPFNRATALGNGVIRTCVDWPKTKVAPPPKPGRLTHPTLFIAGQYDLSTPASYARRELRRAPKGKLVVIPRAGHGVAFDTKCSLRAIKRFMAGKLKGDPCRRSGG